MLIQPRTCCVKLKCWWSWSWRFGRMGDEWSWCYHRLTGNIFGSAPCVGICPHCKEQVTTITQKEIGMMNHAAAGAACFFGFCLCAPCAYLIPDLKDTRHSCPKCARYLGKREQHLWRGDQTTTWYRFFFSFFCAFCSRSTGHFYASAASLFQNIVSLYCC